MPERRHQLARISLSNFKRFEKLELDLESFDLLVGPNNSGKSTVLQGCVLFDFCYRTCLRREGGVLQFAADARILDDEIPIPTADLADLWHQGDPASDMEGRRARRPDPITVEADFRAGQRYRFRIEGPTTVYSHPDNPAPIPPEQFGVAFVPGYVGFLPREERRTPAVIRSLRAEGQHGGVIRNLLLDLRQQEGPWGLFTSLLGDIFPEIQLHPAEFDAQVDRFIRAEYEELRGKEHHHLDLFAAGSGFHQFVQIFAGILSAGATTVLLDEPDAHLFSKLQGRLFHTLRTLVARGYQVIAATHSPDLIAAASPAQIISFANGTPRRLQVRAEAAQAARSLGALENLGLLLIDAYGKVIVVEDHSDEDYVRWWLEALLPAEQWRRISGRLVFLHAHQRPRGDQVNLMLDTIERTFAAERRIEVRAFVLADRDYLLDEELGAEKAKLGGARFQRQRWHVWHRAEVENYLLVPAAIARLAAASEAAPPAAEIGAELEAALEASREATRKKLIDAFGRYSRESKKFWEPSTMVERAEAYLDAQWQGDGRLGLCDAKEVVLPTLRQRVKERRQLPLPDREIVRATRPEEAPDDLLDFARSLSSFLLGGSDPGTAAG